MVYNLTFRYDSKMVFMFWDLLVFSLFYRISSNV